MKREEADWVMYGKITPWYKSKYQYMPGSFLLLKNEQSFDQDKSYNWNIRTKHNFILTYGSHFFVLISVAFSIHGGIQTLGSNILYY